MSKKCEHSWSYVCTVYLLPSAEECVRRWCTECGLEQAGLITTWREARPDEFSVSAKVQAQLLEAKEPTND